MSHPVGISFADALDTMRRVGNEYRVASERVALNRARGRVLAQPIAAPVSLPMFDNSAMDGFAVRASELLDGATTCLRLAGTQFAGDDLALAAAPAHCLRITTGAPLPHWADTVVIKEHTRLDGDSVVIEPGTTHGANVRRIGSDVMRGDTVMSAGATLGSAGLGLLASLGLADVEVASLPSVAVFTTGDELRPLGATLTPGQIYDSNRILLQSLLAEEHIATLSWPALPDDEARMASALHDASQAYDLILTCGGVSAGEKDLLPGLLAKHGRIHFWKVMMRPGMPVLFGAWGRSLVLGLPGNPVSVLATFRRLALPLLDAMQSRIDRAPALRARLLAPVSKSHARLEFRRARLSCDAQGQLGAVSHPATGSHQQRGASDSNALIVLPEAARELELGAVVDVEPYGAILRE
jgi:molybdopterin molybdotransferase